MAVCKHCGTEIEDGLEYCPNCGQSIDENYGEFFEPDEQLEEEAYNIFDTPEEFDMDSLLSREFEQGTAVSPAESNEYYLSSTEEEDALGLDELFGFAEMDQTEIQDFEPVEESVQDVAEEADNMAELLGLFDAESSGEVEELTTEPVSGIEFQEAEETDFFALDDLFEEIDAEQAEPVSDEQENVDPGLAELLAASTSEQEADEGKKQKEKKTKKKKKEKKSFFKTVFGNVPVDPSKVKPEPTPEQIAAKKAKEAEEKKAKAEGKKLAAEEKKQIAQRNKDEKARQKALAKEEKKAKKMEEAKQILEEMKETRINRLGATIVFVFFIVCAIALLSGSEIFGYAISVHSAEKNFNKAYNNNVKYYTDAYNDIYGLEIKPEDQVLNDKVMTVMFVNKHLNSYNSYMLLHDYQAALHSLLLGLYRYGAYYEKAVPLGIERDMDYVRTQILKELEATFGVSEDEAELLRSMLADTNVGGLTNSVDEDAAREYNVKLYEIIKESGLKDDSNN